MPKADRKEAAKQISAYIKSWCEDEVASSKSKAENKLALNTVRDVLFLNDFKRIAKEVFVGKFQAPKTYIRANGPAKRMVNLVLSDLHYGSDLSEKSVPFRYRTGRRSPSYGSSSGSDGGLQDTIP